MSNQSKYWVVGAKWGGQEETLDTFLQRGYWYCHPTEPENKSLCGNSIEAQRDRFRQIKAGDRIAVKRMNGDEARVLAIGIAKADADEQEWRVYVDWIALAVDAKVELEQKNYFAPSMHMFPARSVPLQGLTASIHGPYELGRNDKFIQSIFHL